MRTKKSLIAFAVTMMSCGAALGMMAMVWVR